MDRTSQISALANKFSLIFNLCYWKRKNLQLVMPAAYVTLTYVIQTFLLLQNITIVNIAIV